MNSREASDSNSALVSKQNFWDTATSRNKFPNLLTTPNMYKENISDENEEEYEALETQERFRLEAQEQ